MDNGFHSVVFYESHDDLWGRLAPTLASAERGGVRWRYVTDRPSSDALIADGVIAPARVIDAASLGMCDTPVKVRAVVSRLAEQASAAAAEGDSGLLAVIDMGWLLNTPSGIAHHTEFEASLDAAIHDWPIGFVCLYNQPIFPDSMIIDALQTHRFVASAAGQRRNPHFLPPEAFLSGDPAAKLQCWLSNLGPAVAEDWRRALSQLGGGPRPGASPSTLFSILPGGRARRREAGSDPLAGLDIVPAPRQRWKIRCFGNLRIYREDGTPVRWNVVSGATVKTKTLFAFLLNRGPRGASGEEIADLLWPEAQSSSQSLNRLYHTVHCLRMALSPELTSSRESPYVVGHDHRYYLALPEGTWVDVPVFEEFARRGEKLLHAGNLEESLACHLAAEKLYTGSLFADVPVQYAENMDNDWCWSRRYWLEEIYVKMLTYTATLYRRLGDSERAVAYAERVLDIDPCFEPAHQEIMRAFHSTGRRDALERQYRLCCGALKRYEERAPSPDTRVLFRQLAS